MLNKPKFMTPSTSMQECVIDINADKIPLSCIIDGNESIAAWQVKIYNLNDNHIVFDSDKKVLDTAFFPIDSRNKNVVFEIDLKKYLPDTPEVYYYSATKVYDENKTYYTRSESGYDYIYELYEYDESTWDTDCSKLFYALQFENSDNPYYWTIAFWCVKDKEAETPTVLSCEEVFYANDTPKPTITYSSKQRNIPVLSDGTVLSGKSYSFYASYKEDVVLKRYGWRITDVDSGKYLIDTISHNCIYGTADNITCFYDGFLNDGKYSIELYIETQNGYSLITKPIYFSVSYTTTVLDNSFSVKELTSEPGILNTWGDSSILSGIANGDISFKKDYPIQNNNSVDIPEDSTITYATEQNFNLDISEDSYITISMQLLNTDNRMIFDISGLDDNTNKISRTLKFESGAFKYSVSKSGKTADADNNDKCIYIPKYTPSRYTWFVITMSPFLGVDGTDTYLSVVESKAANGLYPSSTLYPSSKLYPSFGVWEVVE